MTKVDNNIKPLVVEKPIEWEPCTNSDHWVDMILWGECPRCKGKIQPCKEQSHE